MLETLTVASSALVAYSYLGYPALIWVASRTSVPAVAPPPMPDSALPRLTILIAAHDEEAVIGDRIRDALAGDYPPDLLDVVVASDGSTDATAEVVRNLAGPRVSLLEFRKRRGKAAVLDDAIPLAAGEVVLLSDANTRLDPEAARRLGRCFADPSVGVACGQLILTDPATGRNADGLYWKYENFLRRAEARLDALLGANGAIYAIRRACFVPVPAGTIVDDLVLPMLARLESGCSIVHDPGALAFEETAADLPGEFRRRSRIGAGGFQSLRLLGPLLDPRRGWVALAFFSHKVLRWLGPFFLAGALFGASALAISGRPGYRAFAIAQVAFYALASATALAPPRVRIPMLMRVPALFAGMNLALLAGFFRWASGGATGTWDPTPRAPGGVTR